MLFTRLVRSNAPINVKPRLGVVEGGNPREFDIMKVGVGILTSKMICSEIDSGLQKMSKLPWVMGSIPVGNSDFFFVPRSCHVDYFFLYQEVNSFTSRYFKLNVHKGKIKELDLNILAKDLWYKNP